MKRYRLVFRSAILLLLVLAVGYTLYQNVFAEEKDATLGKEAPNFVAQDLEGNTFELESYKGKGVLLNFWASWCEPCEQEMPYMNSLYEKYKDKGIEILALNADETPLVIDAFVQKYDLKFPILQDKGQKILRLYNVQPLPTTILIDKNGRVIQIVTGTLTEQGIENLLQKIVP